jgi:ABC-type multidrug transport system ATPase subunit
MNITLNNVGKRYNRDWIFRHLDYKFEPGNKYAITGYNGSGKSTLLQVIGGAVAESEGTIKYNINGTDVAEPYQNISIATPYLELIEELNSEELLKFHSTFKPLEKPVNEILEIAGLTKSAHKQIRYYSSGMKQRLKLVQAFFSKTPVLLLDEPTTNLDEEGVRLYHHLITHHTSQRLVIVSSNVQNEYSFADKIIKVEDYK